MNRLSAISTKRFASSGYAQSRFTSELLQALSIAEQTECRDDAHASSTKHDSVLDNTDLDGAKYLVDAEGRVPIEPVLDSCQEQDPVSANYSCRTGGISMQHPAIRRSTQARVNNLGAPGPPPTRPLPALPQGAKPSPRLALGRAPPRSRSD